MRIWRFVWSFLSIIGVSTIIGFIANFDSVHIWLVQPKLEIKVLSWESHRETTSFEKGVPVFDGFEVKLNIIPRVRFHHSPFPINQVKGIVIKKGEWFGGFKTDREIPFNIEDKPVILTLKLIGPPIPIEGANSGKNTVEIRIIDLRGNISIASIENAF